MKATRTVLLVILALPFSASARGEEQATSPQTPAPTATAQGSPTQTPATFYDQLTHGIFRLQAHMSVCSPGRAASVERDEEVGTGFFLADHDVGQPPAIYVVTARHVVDSRKADLTAQVELNSGRSVALYLPAELWVHHPDPAPPGAFPVDVSVMRIPDLREGIRVFMSCTGPKCPPGENDTPKESHLAKDPSPLEHVLLLGFPAGDVPLDAVQPFARSGVVALASPSIRVINGRPSIDNRIFLVDAGSWGGDSGGPVLTEPQPFKKALRLYGVVTAAHSKRSYALVTPVSRVRETLEYARPRAPMNADAWKPRAPITPIPCQRPPVLSGNP